jgi:hypothetical protein
MEVWEPGQRSRQECLGSSRDAAGKPGPCWLPVPSRGALRRGREGPWRLHSSLGGLVPLGTFRCFLCVSVIGDSSGVRDWDNVPISVDAGDPVTCVCVAGKPVFQTLFG